MPRVRSTLPRVRRGIAQLVVGTTSLGCAVCAAASVRPDTYVARVEALAMMQTLNADLLASRSATKTLETWCALHAMAPDPKIVAVRVAGVDKPADDTQRLRLQVGPRDEVRYRRVRLTCGDRVLSEADNWYVPSRLTPDMNHDLETTEVPFGKIVAPLKPTRQTFAAEVLWAVLPSGWDGHTSHAEDHPTEGLDIPPVLFEHHAVLYDSERRPFSEVDEHYTRDILDFAQSR